MKSKIDIKEFMASVLNKLVIPTSNPIYQIWKITIIGSHFFSCFLYTYFACYYDRMESEAINQLKLYEFIFEAFSCLDMILSFFSEYHDPLTQRIEKDFFELSLLYLKNGFIIELIAIIPFYHIFSNFIQK